jgi:hypothetical protein
MAERRGEGAQNTRLAGGLEMWGDQTAWYVWRRAGGSWFASARLGDAWRGHTSRDSVRA